MSTNSHHRPTHSRRIDSLQNTKHAGNGDLGRKGSRVNRRRALDPRSVYLYALRVAYLVYLLHPRQKRMEHVPAAQKAVERTNSNIMQDVMKEFSIASTSKSSRLPKDFMKKLNDRLQKVMIGTEPRPEYKDAVVRRSFAAALNYFLEAGFQKRMEKDRKPDDLVLMFYSRATAELQKGKAPTDDSWKLLVDRHVALFVRLMGLIMKDNEWGRERPELATRLATLESKLLIHDQNLTSGGGDGTYVEVVVPLSQKIKDMPMVLTVGKIFMMSPEELQNDIDQNKDRWTLYEAVQDIKTYQNLLELNSRKTLNSDDFDLESAYEAWKRGETPEISQLLYSIFQAEPELAKNTTQHHMSLEADPAHDQPQVRKVNNDNGDPSPYTFDAPVDMSLISQASSRMAATEENDEHPFTFLPPDRRAYYRAVLFPVLSYEHREHGLQPQDGAEPVRLFSAPTTEFLNELCRVWRIPYVTRVILFLDVVREKYLESSLGIETLDQAFVYIKEGIPGANVKDRNQVLETLADRTRWPLADYALIQQILTSVHEALLRDIYNAAQQCFDPKPPADLGPLMYVLDTYIYDDPSFPKGADELRAFTEQLEVGLKDKASSIYRALFAKNIPKDQDTWELYHVIQLGKAVTGQATKIQKRYKKNPEILGANPLSILVEVIFPEYAMDARDVTAHILQLAKYRGEEVPIEDGFDLYRELVDIRQIHNDALPGVDFAFEIEDQLADFVWRWIKLTEENMPTWVENAAKQDEFKVRSQAGQVPTEEERHSVSVMDIFTSFNQSIERIVNLNWDNDLHYAKFMTAVSKVVCQGLARYCELVEQKFTKEMDRVTPEQEAAASRTRQEKWISAAKEAWSNKEKVEPFQFFPESFVKLNNIDYATRQLDRLEKEVNVDACVAVIEKNTPPPTARQRRTTNYVFTIKIVEAEDLKACDINGLSDPYVVLGDEYQKRLAKTRIIHGNLNPRWDESVDITTQGPLNVVATVWDWDALGEHDCVGRTSIKLDPSHFGDFLPREYWLDLDTQGRLLLRVSMEGERDDIQFYFGKAFRTLKRTERDMTRSITDKVCGGTKARSSCADHAPAALFVHQLLPLAAGAAQPAEQGDQPIDGDVVLQPQQAGGHVDGADGAGDHGGAQGAVHVL